MKAIAMQKGASASEQVAYNPEELNKTFQLASEGEESTAAIPGDVTNFKTSSSEEELPEDVPHVASIVDLANKEG